MPMVFAALVAVALPACADSGSSGRSPAASPVTALHQAVDALRAESGYSLTVTDSRGGVGGAPAIYKVVIEKPERVSITGGLNVIAIRSTGYFKSPSGWWTTVQHAGEAANFTNDMLLYVDILNRATSVTRKRHTYIVAPEDAASLLVTTGLRRFRGATDVSLSATIAGELVRSVSLRTAGALPVTILTVVDDVGSSPAVVAPPASEITSR
jgi:hypothetical protein